MFRLMRKALVTFGFAVAGLAAASSANATLVVGKFDPSFGVAIPGVDFSGTATFNISQNCLDLGLPTGAFVWRGYNCGGSSSAMQFLGADVHFSGAQSGDVHFAADPGNPLIVLGMYVQNGHVTGVQTSGFISAAQSTLPGNQSFSIYFGVDPSTLTWEDFIERQPPVHSGDGDHDLDDLSADSFQQTHLVLLSGCRSDCTSNLATTHYVPEPGSLALVIAALGVAGLASRKRRGVTTL
ncbi:MAG TPA: PEP-CTERM sorting domain-containing protein [Caldimonas sp.]|nr:PEP-CTERM sorting domain-containing protein [Caldimonas sp.]